MDILRWYEPDECDDNGVPWNWEHCQKCDGRGFAGEDDQRCGYCEGYGSLRSSLLDVLAHDRSFRYFADPFRCQACGHPMSEGTWEGPAFTSLAEVQRQELDHAWRCLLEDIEPTGTIGRADYFSPCDDRCRHAGPGRWRSTITGQWLERADDSVSVHRVEMMLKEADPVEASWRPVDVRTLGWPHDLRPERLAILCLRCWAARSSSEIK